MSESLVCNGSRILGTARHSILSNDCFVGKGAEVIDSVLLPGARVNAGATVVRAILGEGAVVKSGATVGSADPSVPIAVVGNAFIVEEG